MNTVGTIKFGNEAEPPCNECLEEFVNLDSHKNI